MSYSDDMSDLRALLEQAHASLTEIAERAITDQDTDEFRRAIAKRSGVDLALDFTRVYDR